MSLSKYALATAAVLGLGLLGGGAAFLAHPMRAGEPAAKQTPPRPAALRQPADPNARGAVLRWKFEKGRPFYQEVTTETLQTMKVMDNDVKQTQKQTFYFRWEPVGQTGDSWSLKQKVEGVAMDIDIGGNKIEYDSTREGTATNPLAETFKAMVGAEFRVTLGRGYRVEKVEGQDELVKRLAAANPQLGKVVGQLFSEEAFRQVAEEPFAALREGAVYPGDFWGRTNRLDMGPVGRYEGKYTYTYQGRDKKDATLDRIKVDVRLTYRGPGEGAGAGGTPFKVKSADFQTSAGSGTVLFDRNKGRVARLELTLNLQGKMTLSIGGEESKVELSQMQRRTVRTTDDNPVLRGKARRDDNELERLREENRRLRRQLEAVREALRRAGKPDE